MAVPRISANAIALWLLPPSALLVYAGFLLPGLQGAQTAYTMPPLGGQRHDGRDQLWGDPWNLAEKSLYTSE